jgi:hypothetical protein
LFGRRITNVKLGSVREEEPLAYCFIIRLEVVAKTLHFSLRLYRLWPDALSVILNQSVRKSDAGKRHSVLPTHPSVQQRQKRMAFVMADMRVEVKWKGNPRFYCRLSSAVLELLRTFFVLKMACNILNV